MVEQKVNKHFLALDNKTLLAPHEAEVIATQRLYGLLHINYKRFREHALVHVLVVYGVGVVEVDKFKQVFVAERAHGPRRQGHRRERLSEVVGQCADMMVIVGAKVLEQLLIRPRSLC